MPGRGLGLVVVVVVVAAGCGGTQPSPCAQGRTVVDGVCVREEVADYVACVRAQGARLDQNASERLSAEAGYLGLSASGSSDVSGSLERTYATSDANVLEIIRACRAISARSDHTGRGDFGSVSMTPDARRWGVSMNQATRASAESLARDYCGDPGCTAQFHFHDSCAAVGETAAGIVYWAAGQADVETSVSELQRECAEAPAAGDPPCKVVFTGCSGR